MTARALFAASLVALSLAATAALGQHRAPTAAAGAHPAPRHAASARAKAAPVSLPDTVLARVTFDHGATLVGVAAYRAGAYSLDADPDSLPLADRRRVLELVIQKAVVNHQVALTPPRWLQRDSIGYDAYHQGLVLRAALDSAEAAMRAHLVALHDTVPAPRVIEVMVRDSALAVLGTTYDRAAIDSLAAAFAALPHDDPRLPTGQRREILSLLPRVAERDSANVLGRCAAGSYTSRELLREYASMGFLGRPNLRTERAVLDVVKNRLYSLVLRREAARKHFETRPDVAALLATRRQFLTVQRFVQDQVYDRVPLDTASVRRWFDRDPARYDVGANAAIVRVLFARRAAADSAAAALAKPGVAESLATQSMFNGVPYQTTLAEEADTVLFARVRRGGVGAIVGPDSTTDGWRVIKVMTLSPRRAQKLAEVFVRARADWVEADGDVRMRALIKQLMAKCRIERNENSPYLTGKVDTIR